MYQINNGYNNGIQIMGGQCMRKEQFGLLIDQRGIIRMERDKSKNPSKVLRSQQKTTRGLLVIPDILRAEGYHQKIQVAFRVDERDQKKYDALLETQERERQRFIVKKAEVAKEESSDGSDESSEDLSDFQSDLEKEDRKDAPASRSQFNQDTDSRYIFTPLSSIKDFFFQVYSKDIRMIEETYKCSTFQGKDRNIEIKCEDPSNVSFIKDQLFSRCQNLHHFTLEQRYKLIIHSPYVQSLLREKNLFMIRRKHNIVIWSLRKYMKEQEFKEIIEDMILRKCKRRIIVLLREPKRRSPNINVELNDFFSIFQERSKKKFQKIQEIYNIKIQCIRRYLEIIIHLQDIEFFEQVHPLIREEFESLMMFELTMDLSHLKELQLSNHCAKKYRFVSFKVFERKRFAVGFPVRKIKTHLSGFLKDLIGLDLLGKGSQLTLPFSHYQNNQQMAYLLNSNLPSGVIVDDRDVLCQYRVKINGTEWDIFEKVLLKLGGMLVGESIFKEEEKTKSLTIDHSYMSESSMVQIQTGIDITINREFSAEQSKYNAPEPEPEPKILQESSQESSSEPSESIKSQEEEPVEQPIQEEYNKIFQLVQRISTNPKGFEVNKKHEEKEELERFLEENLQGREFVTKCIVLPKEWFQKPLVNPLIYVTDQEFIENQEPKFCLKVQRLDPKVNRFKYLIQASRVLGEGDETIAEYGYYLPVYQIEQL